MTRNGHACALPTPGRRTAATGSSSSRTSQPPGPGLRLLPTPVAGAFNDGEPVTSWLARRDLQKKLGRNGNGIGTPLSIAIALLPPRWPATVQPNASRGWAGSRPRAPNGKSGRPR